MQNLKVDKIYSHEEYMELEERSLERHEYIAGYIYPLETAMAGGQWAHSIITMMIGTALRNRLPQTCSVTSPDMAVHIEKFDVTVYPDVSVVCSSPKFEPHPQNKKLWLLNPLLLVEVLSQTTDNFDHTEKWEFYRSIPSLTDYILVSSDRYYIEHYVKNEGGKWTLYEYDELDAELIIESFGISILLEEIYGNVELAPAYRKRPLKVVK